VLYAGREGEGGEYHNRVAGLDGSFQMSDADTLRVQYLRSQTQYPQEIVDGFGQPTGGFGANGWRADYNHSTRNWNAFLTLQDLDEGFRADSGFVPRVDVKTADGTLAREFWGTGKEWWNQVEIGAEALRTDNHHGDLTDQGFFLFGTLFAKLQTVVGVTLGREKTLFGETLYDQLSWGRVTFSMQPTGIVKLDLQVRRGDTIDFANNRPARELRLAPTIELKLGTHLNTQLEHTYQRLEVLGGQELFTANLSQLRAIYNFNVRMFVRAIVQHQDVARNPGVYGFPVLDDEKTMFTQLLFSYKLNPQTVLFLGYSDDSAGFEQGVQTVDLTRADRTFFAKVGYAFLF